jgi:hypothetical protein
MEKEICVFKAGEHEKEWRVRASSNGNKGGGGERKKPGLTPTASLGWYTWLCNQS